MDDKEVDKNYLFMGICLLTGIVGIFAGVFTYNDLLLYLGAALFVGGVGLGFLKLLSGQQEDARKLEEWKKARNSDN